MRKYLGTHKKAHRMAEFGFLVQESVIALCLLLSFQLATTSVHASTSNGSCIAGERAALLSIKANLSDPNNHLSSWQGEDCCRWKGVRCSNNTGHVVKLNLRGSTIFADQLGGEISYSLVSLQQLRHLDLSCNNFRGEQIPEFLGSLSSLRYLNLSYSFFYGRIPPQLGNLSKLIYLDLNFGDSYILPFSNDLEWLSHLSSLKHLDMSYVNLSTAVNWVHEVNMLRTLKKLYLQFTGIRNRVVFLGQSNLTALEELDISRNNFDTTIAPNWFWTTTSLTFLNIRDCYFYGPIPDEIGNMTSLEQVYFRRNDLMSTMIPSSFQNLCNLNVLDLESSNTSGDITELMERLPNCPWNKLQMLDLSANNISGALPNLPGPLTNLTYLVLSYNKLTGTIPSWIGALTKLSILDLDSNNLNGIVTEDHFESLTNLKLLGLSNPHLQMKVGPNWVPPFKLWAFLLASLDLGPEFPPWLRSQTSMKILHISNASITAIPDWFWVAFSRAEFLDLSDNQITGKLPATLEFMAVDTLVLFNNRFTGTVPKFPRNITFVDISRNSLSGTLPSDFGAPLLKVLILYNNSISGTIPSSLCSLEHLIVLDLSVNMLTGEVPTCQENSIQRIQALYLYVVNLNSNNLSGEFPSVFRICPDLVFLDLSYNRFTANLPVWMGEKLPYLALLRVRSNMFSGHIPIELAMIRYLQFLDLAQNNLSGSIPDSLVNLSAMTRTSGYSTVLKEAITIFQGPHLYNSVYDLIYFTDKVSVLTKGQQLEFFQGIVYMVNLDLSCNSLTGAIPQDIGALIGLISMNFSSNRLSGEIPEKIGQLKQLASLDLSHNELSGEIPSSMSALTSLSYMNLSYNNLSGKIPTGNQLDTFRDGSIYIGNIGLCGPPLTNTCPGNESSQPTHENHRDGLEDISLYLGMIIGFVLGLWVVFCVMLFKNKWRNAYFMYVEGLVDKIYVTVVVRWTILKSKLGKK